MERFSEAFIQSILHIQFKGVPVVSTENSASFCPFYKTSQAPGIKAWEFQQLQAFVGPFPSSRPRPL